MRFFRAGLEDLVAFDCPRSVIYSTTWQPEESTSPRALLASPIDLFSSYASPWYEGRVIPLVAQVALPEIIPFFMQTQSIEAAHKEVIDPCPRLSKFSFPADALVQAREVSPFSMLSMRMPRTLHALDAVVYDSHCFFSVQFLATQTLDSVRRVILRT